jgi:hypothetical protein
VKAIEAVRGWLWRVLHDVGEGFSENGVTLRDVDQHEDGTMVLLTPAGRYRLTLVREPDLRVEVNLEPWQKKTVVAEVSRDGDLDVMESDSEVVGDVWCRVRAGPSWDYISGEWQSVEVYFARHELPWPPSPGTTWSLLFYRGQRVEFEFENRSGAKASARVNLYGVRCMLIRLTPMIPHATLGAVTKAGRARAATRTRP